MDNGQLTMKNCELRITSYYGLRDGSGAGIYN